MAEKPLDDLLNDGVTPAPTPAAPSTVPAQPAAPAAPVVPAINVPSRGGAQARIKEVITQRNKLVEAKDAEIADLKAKLAQTAQPALDESPEDFVADVVNKTVGPQLEQLAKATAETEIKNAVVSVPGAEKFMDEIRKTGEVHNTLPWDDVVRLVMTKHNAMPDNTVIDATASMAALGGNSNPGSRREPSIRAKTTAQLEQDILNAPADELRDTLSGGLY